MDFSGKRVLITTSEWFYAPDGQSYRAIWGSAEVQKSEDLLGVKPHNYANWFAVVNGTFLIAGCQIHYVMLCEEKPAGSHVYIPQEEVKG